MEFNRNRLYHSLGPVTRMARNGYRGHMKGSRYQPLVFRGQTFSSGVGDLVDIEVGAI